LFDLRRDLCYLGVLRVDVKSTRFLIITLGFRSSIELLEIFNLKQEVHQGIITVVNPTLTLT